MIEHVMKKPEQELFQREIGRRSVLNLFLKGGVGAFLVSVFYPVWRYLQPPKTGEAAPRSVRAGSVAAMKPNSGEIFRFGTTPGILIRTPQGELRAFSAVCTHLDCTVQFRENLEHIWCACHNGHYDLRGINIQGPPPRPLEQYDVAVVGDDVFVSRTLRG